jgi:hypothetical protein
LSTKSELQEPSRRKPMLRGQSGQVGFRFYVDAYRAVVVKCPVTRGVCVVEGEFVVEPDQTGGFEERTGFVHSQDCVP